MGYCWLQAVWTDQNASLESSLDMPLVVSEFTGETIR